MRKYKVILAIEVEGKIYEYGETVELDAETAARYAHALIPEEETDAPKKPAPKKRDVT